MKKPSILFLINSFTVGGAERVFVDDLLTLHKEGWDVQAAVLFERGEFAQELEAAGITIHDLKFRSAMDKEGVRRLIALTNDLQCNVVLSTLNEANAAARLGKARGGRYGLISREANMADVKGLRYKFNDIFYGKYSDKIIAVSNAVAQSVYAYAPWLKSRMVVLYNGTDVNRPVPDREMQENVRLMTIGSLTEKKDHEVLIRAMALLPATYSLTIIGSGPLKEHLEKLAAEFKLTDRVQLIGRQSRDQVYASLEAHDLFVLPSKREGCPNVVSEAQAAGLGVVAFAIPGMDEFVSESSGVLVHERKSQSLSLGIEEASKKRVMLGQSGRQEVLQKRSKDVHIQALVSLLESLLYYGAQ